MENPGDPAFACAGAAVPNPLTTFVQADSDSFRPIVQRFTGATRVAGVKRPPSKLHERRQNSKSRLGIVDLSIEGDGGLKGAESVVSEMVDNGEEERAIRERRFYLRASPRCRQGQSEPELLALFPLTSPTLGDRS